MSINIHEDSSDFSNLYERRKEKKEKLMRSKREKEK